MCVGVCLHVCSMYVYEAHREQKRTSDPLEHIADSRESPCGCWELNQGRSARAASTCSQATLPF